MLRIRQILLLTLVASTLCVDATTLRHDRRNRPQSVAVRLIALARGVVRQKANGLRLLARRGLALAVRYKVRPQQRVLPRPVTFTAPLLRLPPPAWSIA